MSLFLYNTTSCPPIYYETMANWSPFVHEGMMPHMKYFYIGSWLSLFVLKLEYNVSSKFNADRRDSTAALLLELGYYSQTSIYPCKSKGLYEVQIFAIILLF